MEDSNNEKIRSEKDIIDEVIKLQQTQGSKKLWNYFLDLTKNPKFIKDIEEIREKYINVSKDKEIIQPYFLREAEDIALKYGLDAILWYEDIAMYIQDGTLNQPHVSMCLISDILEEKQDPYSDSTLEIWDTAYPISLRISPYASKRDVLDYVSRMYNIYIKPLQKKYKKDEIKIGKAKNKKESIQKRNEFIYENRHLSRKEIMHLIGDKFGANAIIDYGYIGKIISLENKKRKNV